MTDTKQQEKNYRENWTKLQTTQKMKLLIIKEIIEVESQRIQYCVLFFVKRSISDIGVLKRALSMDLRDLGTG